MDESKTVDFKPCMVLGEYRDLATGLIVRRIATLEGKCFWTACGPVRVKTQQGVAQVNVPEVMVILMKDDDPEPPGPAKVTEALQKGLTAIQAAARDMIAEATKPRIALAGIVPPAGRG
jgi:hypothetical protein